jgi:hypothetical protein
MSIIEDQQRAVAEEIKKARNQRMRAEQEKEAEKSKYLWAKANPSLALDANFFILENYLANAGIQISVDSLDLASRACKSQLAERLPEVVVPELTPEEKVRAENARLKSLSREELRAEIQTGIKKKLATPEYGGHGRTDYVPQFTAAEFKRFSPSKVRAILYYEGSNQERPGVRAAIDQMLLQDAATKSNQ